MHPKLSNDRAIRIVAAAREEFAARGFDGARMDRIARRAGTNKQLLFYYYHSKRGLFQTVLGQAAKALEAHVAATALGAGQPLDRLRRALEAQFEYLADHPTYAALLAQAGRSEARPLSPALARLVVLVAEGQGRGQVRDDVDPHIAAAQALVLMLAYLMLEPLVATTAAPLGDELGLAVRWKDATVKLLVEGLTAR